MASGVYGISLSVTVKVMVG